ncbi:MAG: 16S rRNA (guanine(527)-N(7))-methyltransferase RsmG [Candidatus Faecivicinus sp.]
MLQDMLLTSAKAMGIPMSPAQADQFARYHGMLTEANAKFNLTRVPDELREAADRNYLDCISPLAHGFPEGVKSLVDVGSGAGFPGIPLSIMLPEVHVVMVDALDKRVKFLRSVIDALGLNAEAVHARAEDAARRPELREQFDMAAARAVAPLNVLCEYLLPFVHVGGWMLALKGPSLDDELAEAGRALQLLGGRAVRVEPAEIPGRDWSHRLAYLEKVAPTPEKYPRKAGVPEKKPLIVTK